MHFQGWKGRQPTHNFASRRQLHYERAAATGYDKLNGDEGSSLRVQIFNEASHKELKGLGITTPGMVSCGMLLQWV